MAVFDWLFGRNRKELKEVLQTLPWDRHPSIYEHIKAHIRPGQKGLVEGGQVLPDEERIAAKSSLRWAAGAMDGVSVYHMGGKDKDQAEHLLNLVRGYWTSPTAKNKSRVYEFFQENGVVSLVDPFLESLRKQTNVNHGRLYDLAKSFATEAPDREPVKFGIAVLGLYSQQLDIEVFSILGRHEELTLFCAVALGNTCQDGEKEIWELAKQVDGWGRVHLVERLSKTENPEIKDWLLREGYKNSIMYEYLAYPCAVGGGLLDALEAGEVDDDLLLSAAEIIQALISGGPAQNMDDYEDGAIVAQIFLNLVETRGSTLVELLSVDAIKRFLSNEGADWQARNNRGWTQEKREAMAHQCSEIIQQPQWRDCVLTGLRSNDEQEFYNADRAAAVLRIDTWFFHWDRLNEQPLQSGRWYFVMRECNDSRIADVIALAESTLPLQDIASGAGMEMGLGPAFESHRCLDYILQDLGKYPLYGVWLIETGMNCPVIRGRNMALKTLSIWGKEKWPDGMVGLLKKASKCEPDQKVRQLIGDVLAGKAWEDQKLVV